MNPSTSGGRGHLGLFRVLSLIAALLVLEVGLSFIDPPKTWRAGSFDGHRLSLRAWKWIDHQMDGEFNRYGYRDIDWAPSDSAPRAAFLGDSRIFGLHVDATETISARLGAHASPWQGMNFGLMGTTPVEILDYMAADVNGFAPDAVIICADINSSVLGLDTRRNFSRRNHAMTNLLRSSSILRWGDLSWRALRAGGKRVLVQELETYRSDLAASLQRFAQAGVRQRVVMVGWTPMPGFDGIWDPDVYDRYREASREAAEQAGAEVIEVEEVLLGMNKKDAFVGIGLHFSPLANDRIAQQVARVLLPPEEP